MSATPDAAGDADFTVLERVVAPLVNNNEPEAQVVELQGQPGTEVALGDVICTLETSKSTVDVEAEVTGFLGPFAVALDDRIMAGDLIVEILDRPAPAGHTVASPRAEASARLTKKARARAEELGVALDGLPTDRILTERDIDALAPAGPPDATLPEDLVNRISDRSVVVVGGGGLGKSIIEVISRHGELEPLCVVDDALAAGEDVLGVPVVGSVALLGALAAEGARHGVNAVGGIGRMRTRTDVFSTITRAGLGSITIVDPSAQISPSALLDPGVHVMPAAVVWSLAHIGSDTLVNTGAIVSHDCQVGANVHLAPGATLAGEVVVGDGTLIGMGVTTRVGARIGADAIVGNGVVVNDDVPDGAIVPSGTTWPPAS